MSKAAYFHEFAEKPPCQVDEMNALIDQFSASRPLRLSAPFAGEPKSAAMPVAGPHAQQRTQYSRIDKAPGLLKGPVIAKIEAHPDTNTAFSGELRQTI